MREVKIPFAETLVKGRDLMPVQGVRCVSLRELDADNPSGLPFEVRICHCHDAPHLEKILGGDEVNRFANEDSAMQWFNAMATALAGPVKAKALLSRTVPGRVATGGEGGEGGAGGASSGGSGNLILP